MSKLGTADPFPKKTKVLWFVTPVDQRVVVGGTLGRLLKWYRAIDHTKYDVRVLVSGPHADALESLKAAYAENGLNIDVIPGLTLAGAIQPKTISTFLTYVSSVGVDVIHTLFVQADLLTAYLKYQLGCKPLISSLEGALYPKSGVKGVIYRMLYVALRARLDAVIALCNFTRVQAIEEYGVPAAKCRVVYSGIDVSRFPFPHVIRRSAEPLTIGFLGSIDSGKRIDLFIDIIPRLLRKNSKLRFVVGGIGRDLSRVMARVEELNLGEQVSFKGFVKDVPRFFEHVDIYVFLSEREGLPWAILESQAAGVPTIASAVGGVPEVIRDGYNGMLLQSASLEELCGKVEALVGDVELRQTFSSNGRARVEREFSSHREMRQIEALYDRMVAAI